MGTDTSTETTRWDLIVIGAGPTGLATAIEAEKLGISTLVIEKGCLVNSIFHYPTSMVFFTTSERLEIGDIPMTAASAKPTRLEALAYYRKVAQHYKLNVHQYERVERLEGGSGGFCVQTKHANGRSASYAARKLVIATGYYDLPNRLGVPGEEQPNVFHYYKEAHPFAGSRVVVIGGKNSAVDAALELFRHGAQVTLVYRRPQLSSSVKYWVRPDIENRIKAGEIAARLGYQVLEIEPDAVRIAPLGESGGEPAGGERLPADFVFALIGYHLDFNFLEAAGVRFQADHQRPICDPQTCESNVPGLYLAGVVVGGRQTGEIFIENGRFHGKIIAEHVRRQLAKSGAAAVIPRAGSRS